MASHRADNVDRYRNGKLIEVDIPDAERYWTDESVAFLSMPSQLSIRDAEKTLIAQSAAHSPLSKHWPTPD
jgi:hypothetical protein